MTNDSKLTVSSEGLTEIVKSVFEVMTGLNVIPCRIPWFPSRDRLTAAVRLEGKGSTAVRIECDRAQARRLAGRFLSVEPPDSGSVVVSDVLGELANMIGGNLKCFLRQGMDISIPSVVDCGDDGFLDPGEDDVVKRLAFEDNGAVFWVSVLALPN